MTQRRTHSLIETLASTTIGFAISLAAQYAIAPLFDWHMTLGMNLELMTIFTGISIVRGYCVRRLFNWIGGRA